MSGASAKRCRNALIATSPSNCDDLDRVGRLLPGSPSVPGGIALRARKSSRALGAAMLGPPSPCGRRIDEMEFGTAVDPWMSGLRTAAASGAVGGASVSSLMSGATGGDCVSEGCDGAGSERRSPSGAASNALAGASVLRGRSIGRFARALIAPDAASVPIGLPAGSSAAADVSAPTGLSVPAGLSASADLAALAGLAAPAGLAALAGLAAVGGTGSVRADTPPTSGVPGDAPLDVTPLTSSSSWTGVLMNISPVRPTRSMPSRAWPLTNPAQRRSRSWLHLTKSLKRRSRSSSLPSVSTPRRLLKNSLN